MAALVFSLDAVAHVRVSALEDVLLLVRAHVQQDVVDVLALVREFVVAVAAVVVLTIVLGLAEVVAEDVLDAINICKVTHND